MEAGSDGESNKNNNNGPSEGPKKPKRQMKTPFQLETLEKTYAAEMYPSEATRVELSEKLGLTDRQLQMWFCHRRLKGKKEGVAKKPRLAEAVERDELMAAEPRDHHGSGSQSRSRSISGSGSGPGSDSSQFEYGNDVPLVRRFYQLSPRSAMERRVITCVELQLGEQLREDGPILGMEFDEPPPGAFGAPIVVKEHRERSGHSHDGKLFERFDAKPIKASTRGFHELAEPSVRSDAYGRIPYDLPVDGPSVNRLSYVQENRQLSRGYGAEGQESSVCILSQQRKQELLSSPPLQSVSILSQQRKQERLSSPPLQSVSILSQQRTQERLSSPPKDNDCDTINEDVLPVGKKRKSDDARIGREVQANEKRIQKELEKQDLLRRKREEQMKKEMEKQDRERRKEEERMIREKQRQEEKFQREERREIERREKFLQKEFLKAERRRQKEELRREKEAARVKAAVERATARRIARESMELIEDDRLELMELAASSKGLSSIVSLNHDTLENLESFRDSLSAFPPKSVELKRPFAIQPWIYSKDNVGNLLMVWRFCITFADVLGLWPFTLDEFVQAFHDYDSRLLGEIHIALLKLVIKDIEDVARTPSSGSGTNQYSAANPEGGHSQIVEGAYLWGFDIRNWQNHLNPLTWPEVLRQFALSAGFGPQLKKKTTEQACLRDNDEGRGCQDAVSMLRNGSAAENAVAVMQEKGFPLQRRSRHRLTPGTVKFAAYHVLSLEGSKGLMVLELADKIQKSGLRDLRTSKTPDASISVALSRDPILFERIAPSTYCVRPAFRKDPANAEVIISAAREKIQRYVNGFLAEENAYDVEKDDDSECDDVEGPEVDDLGTPSTANKQSDHCDEVSTCEANGKDNLFNDVALNLQNELDTASDPIDQFIDVAGEGIGASNLDQGGTEIDESKSGQPWVQGLAEGEYSDLCVEERLSALVALIGLANEGNIIRSVLEDRLDAANALKKQMWAEAQLDKRRLKDEGITKFHDSYLVAAAEGSQSPYAVVDNKNRSQSPLAVVNNKNFESSLSTAVNEEPSMVTDNVPNHLSNMPAERSLLVHDTFMGQITPPIQQNGCTAERSRLQLKSFIGHRAEEMYVYRSLPLGQDRRRNRYWQFVASASRHDPGSGRIFVELPDGQWRLIDSEEAFDSLLTSLDTRGIRESHLHIMLQKIEMPFKENVRRNLLCASIVRQSGTVGKEVAEMGSSPTCIAGADSPSSAVCGSNSDTWELSSSFKIEFGRNETEKKNALKRYQDLQTWMWKECFNSSTLCAMAYGKKGCAPLLGICNFCIDSYIFEENLCPSCHGTFGTFDDSLNYLEYVIQCEEKSEVKPKNLIISDSSHPLRIRLIKALLTFLEVCVPSEALQSVWMETHRKTWSLKLHRSSYTGDLLQILTQLEGVIKRDSLSSNFETTEELLGSCGLSGRDICESACTGTVAQLPWIPQTTAAVALRLLELDSSIAYILRQKVKPHNEMEVEDFINLPSRYAYMKNIQKGEPTEIDKDENMKEENWVSLDLIRGSSASTRKAVSGRGGGRPRGRWTKKVAGPLSKSGRRTVGDNETLTQFLIQHGQRSHGQKHGRGRRTVRRRRTEKAAIEETPLPDHLVESPINSGGEEWVGEENGGKMQMEDADNSNSMEASESDDDDDDDDDNNAIENEGRRWGSPGFDVGSNTRTWDLVETSDDDVDVDVDVDESEDGNGYEVGEDEEDNLEGDVDMNDGSGGNGDEIEDEEGSDSVVSGDYSD